MELGERMRIEADWLPPVAGLAHFEPPAGAHLATPRQIEDQEQHARYGFRIDVLGLLIDPDTGSEVIPLPDIASLPGAPAGFLGLANIRGNLVPIYELRVLMEIGPRPAGVEPVALVFGEGENAVGILVEGYPVPLADLQPLARSDIPTIPSALEKLQPAAYVQNDTVWLEFDHNAFFDMVLQRTELTT